MENEKQSQIWFKAIKARDACGRGGCKARDESRNGKKNKKDKGLLSENWPQPSLRIQNELYLVEGDSPVVLLNKVVTVNSVILPSFVARSIQPRLMADILKKWRNNTMIYTIGAGVSRLRLKTPTGDKIIIKDRCGYRSVHYSNTLLTFFTAMRPLVEAGHYRLLPPFFTRCQKGKVRKKKWPTLGQMVARKNYVKKFGKGATLQRYKGLARWMDQLWETTMNPETAPSSVSRSWKT